MKMLRVHLVHQIVHHNVNLQPTSLDLKREEGV